MSTNWDSKKTCIQEVQKDKPMYNLIIYNIFRLCRIECLRIVDWVVCNISVITEPGSTTVQQIYITRMQKNHKPVVMLAQNVKYPQVTKCLLFQVTMPYCYFFSVYSIKELEVTTSSLIICCFVGSL